MSFDQDVFEDEVRTLFAEVDPPPSTVNSDRALAAGRRKARRRWLTAGTAMAAAVVVLAGVPLGAAALPGKPSESSGVAAGPAAGTGAAGISDATAKARLASCTPSELALPPGVTSAEVSGVDPTGRYIVGSSNDRAATGMTSLHAILWDGGHSRVIPVTGESVSAVAVNSQGVVAGQGVRDDADSDFGWVYRDGAVTELAPPAGYAGATAEAINARGDVVGVAMTAGGTRSAAVLWRRGDTAGHVLPAPGNAGAYGIADDGTVVGMLVGGNGPYLWQPDGTGRRLSSPDGFTGGGAMAISGDWVVGFATPAAKAGASHAPTPGAPGPDAVTGMAVRWNLRTGRASRYDADLFTRVNARGDAVAQYRGGASAWISVGSDHVTLKPLAPGGKSYPIGLDDADTVVVGYATGPGEPSVNKPVAWLC